MMNPNPQNPHPFTYPQDRLLRLSGTIPDGELRRPTTLNMNDDPCLVVIKRSAASGLTFGHAHDIVSYARDYYNGGDTKGSKDWSIRPAPGLPGPFSRKSDSGAVIVDGRGRIGGLLTGGSGLTDSLDITYATPINFLMRSMCNQGLVFEIDQDPAVLSK